MNPLYDVWPFNVPAGPGFLFLFLPLAAGSMLLTYAAGALWSAAHERGEAEGLPLDRPDAGAVYRRSPSQRRFAIGCPPSVEDAWTIAYLRDGTEGVAEALIAGGVAQGWIRGAQEDFAVSVPSERVDDAWLEALRRRLAGAPSHAQAVREAARSVARSREWELAANVRRAGHARSAHVRTVVTSLVAAGALFVEAIGIVRCVRATTLHHRFGFLALEMIVFAIAAVWLVRRAHRERSRRATRYLAWLEDVTRSLRSDVARKRSASPQEVVLVAGIGGLGAIGGAGELGSPQATIAWIASPTIGTDGGSSAGCGSSGCGGGGCGGGGCGG